MHVERTQLHISTNLTSLKRFRGFGTRGGIAVEKAKSLMIFVLTITLFASYFMMYNLWMDNRNLKFKVYDLQSALRVHERIQQTGKNGG